MGTNKNVGALLKLMGMATNLGALLKFMGTTTLLFRLLSLHVEGPMGLYFLKNSGARPHFYSGSRLCLHVYMSIY